MHDHAEEQYDEQLKIMLRSGGGHCDRFADGPYKTRVSAWLEGQEPQ